MLKEQYTKILKIIQYIPDISLTWGIIYISKMPRGFSEFFEVFCDFTHGTLYS